jgi:hypothetical protein
MPTSLRLCLLVPWLWLASNACQKQCPPEFMRDGAFCRVKDDTDAAMALGISPQAGASANAWHCEGDATSCTCTQGQTAGDTCPVPKPTCCFTLEGTPERCSCWPQDSEPCRSLPTTMPAAKAVTSCPPP